MKSRPTPKLKKHRTAQLLWRRHLKPMMDDVGAKNVKEFAYGNMNHAAVMSAINGAGFWGFYDTSKQTIHYWHDSKRSVLEMIGFFAHEMQHHVDDHWPKCKSRNKTVQEEHRADVACEVARIAYVLAKGTAAHGVVKATHDLLKTFNATGGEGS